MENTKEKIDYVLSKKRGKDRLLVLCFYAISALSAVCCYLYFSKENMRTNYEEEIKQINMQNFKERTDNVKRYNDFLFGLIKQVDSANIKLQIFQIQKQMK